MFASREMQSVLRKRFVTMSVFLKIGRLWIEEEEIINFREFWTEKTGSFKIILNCHFIMQWKGLEGIIKPEVDIKKGKQNISCSK